MQLVRTDGTADASRRGTVAPLTLLSQQTELEKPKGKFKFSDYYIEVYHYHVIPLSNTVEEFMKLRKLN